MYIPSCLIYMYNVLVLKMNTYWLKTTTLRFWKCGDLKRNYTLFKKKVMCIGLIIFFSDNTHGRIKIYRVFYHGIVYIGNEWRHYIIFVFQFIAKVYWSDYASKNGIFVNILKIVFLFFFFFFHVILDFYFVRYIIFNLW